VLCESINIPSLRNCPSRLRRPCSSSISPFCLRVAGRGRDVVETAKSILGLEETARQLLFLHSSKSSLESNLPVCYCIQTTPQPTSSVTSLQPPPRPLLFYGCCRSVYSLSHTNTNTHIHTRARAHTAAYICAHTLWDTRSCTRTLPPRFVLIRPRSRTHKFCMHASCLAFR